jgi:hypothetical protein
LLAGATGFALVFLPQARAYVVLNGHLGPARVIADKMYWQAPHAGQVLFSPEHGLFAWTPLALIAVAGLVAGMLRDPAAEGGGVHAPTVPSIFEDDRRRVLGCLLVMFLAQVYISGSVDTWTVAGSFGQRRFIGAAVVFTVGLAALIVRAHRWPRAAFLVLVMAVWWNLGLMVQFGAGMMDRQRLELARNSANTYIRVPLELPDLAYRYLFDRGSFFKPSSATSPP